MIARWLDGHAADGMWTPMPDIRARSATGAGWPVPAAATGSEVEAGCPVREPLRASAGRCPAERDLAGRGHLPARPHHLRHAAVSTWAPRRGPVTDRGRLLADRVVTAQRGRPGRPGRDLGRAQRRCPAGGLRELHRSSKPRVRPHRVCSSRRRVVAISPPSPRAGRIARRGGGGKGWRSHRAATPCGRHHDVGAQRPRGRARLPDSRSSTSMAVGNRVRVSALARGWRRVRLERRSWGCATTRCVRRGPPLGPPAPGRPRGGPRRSR